MLLLPLAAWATASNWTNAEGGPLQHDPLAPLLDRAPSSSPPLGPLPAAGARKPPPFTYSYAAGGGRRKRA